MPARSRRHRHPDAHALSPGRSARPVWLGEWARSLRGAVCCMQPSAYASSLPLQKIPPEDRPVLDQAAATWGQTASCFSLGLRGGYGCLGGAAALAASSAAQQFIDAGRHAIGTIEVEAEFRYVAHAHALQQLMPDKS